VQGDTIIGLRASLTAVTSVSKDYRLGARTGVGEQLLENRDERGAVDRECLEGGGACRGEGGDMQQTQETTRRLATERRMKGSTGDPYVGVEALDERERHWMTLELWSCDGGVALILERC
jgi:hypothetical protein